MIKNPDRLSCRDFHLKGHNILSRRCSRLDRRAGEHRSFSPEESVGLKPHCGLNFHPGALTQRAAAGIFTRQPHKGDILCTAGHHKSAGRKLLVRILFQMRHLCLEVYFLALIFLGLFRDIPVEQRIVVVCNLNDRSVDVKWQRVLDVVKLRGSPGV